MSLRPAMAARYAKACRMSALSLVLLSQALLFWFSVNAGIPSPEKLLPDNTLLMLTAPDFVKAREAFAASPFNQLWNDSSMKAFKDKFLSKWDDEVRKPLQREIGINLDDLLSIPQGQVTFALLPIGGTQKEEHSFAKLLLVDSRQRSNQLTTNITALRDKWLEAGKPIKTESIRGFDFAVILFSTNDIPRTIQRLFPPGPQLQELGSENENKKAAADQLVFGQIESLLIVGTSLSAVEKIVTQLTGGSLPVLADVAAYDSIHQALFREAPVYGWMNVKAYVQNKTPSATERRESEGPDPFGNISSEKLIAATGFDSLNAVGFAYDTSAEGGLFQVFAAVPEATRRGIFKIFSSETKDTKPPLFVPADAAKFQRWRIDTQKAWTVLGKMLGELYPQWIGGLDVLLDAANAATREKDPGFDLKKYLIANLGDDVIRYSKPIAASARTPPPSLVLLGSPNPGQLAIALKSLLIFVNQGATPTEREFLGRKVFSLPMPGIALPMASAGGRPAQARTLHCTSSGGYVALSTDVSLLEEFVRSSDSDAKNLNETAGLMEAAQKVIGPGTVVFGYENGAETARPQFDQFKKDGTMPTNSLSAIVGPAFNFPNPQIAIRQLSDISLLPSYERLTKYFHFTVYSLSSSVDGLTFKYFVPTPPRLR